MQVISRQGVATSLEDLRRCSADGASSIVVLSQKAGSLTPDEVDAQVSEREKPYPHGQLV
jgi:hypothetical protein